MNYIYIPFPTFRSPSSITWGLQGLSTPFTSPAGSIQTVERTSLWKATITFQTLESPDMRKLQAFMAKLLNPQNVFQITDPSYVPGGTPAGAPLVNGANQVGGNTLNTKGWTANAVDVLKAGDLITLATKQMLMVTDDVNADASGNATVNVAPYIRTAPADSSVITTTSPTCVMNVPKYAFDVSVSPPIIGDLSFDALEVIL